MTHQPTVYLKLAPRHWPYIKYHISHIKDHKSYVTYHISNIIYRISYIICHVSIYIYMYIIVHTKSNIICIYIYIVVYANGVDNDPWEFAHFPCCLKYMPQLLRLVMHWGCWAGGLGGGAGGGGVGVGWDNNVIGASTHAWCNITEHSLALRTRSIRTSCYSNMMLRSKMSLALAHWCYVVRCLLHLPTDLMLRCKMSLALAHRHDATL